MYGVGHCIARLKVSNLILWHVLPIQVAIVGPRRLEQDGDILVQSRN